MILLGKALSDFFAEGSDRKQFGENFGRHFIAETRSGRV